MRSNDTSRCTPEYVEEVGGMFNGMLCAVSKTKKSSEAIKVISESYLLSIRDGNAF